VEKEDVGMKVTLRQEPGAEKEIIVRYDAMDDEVRATLELLSLCEKRLAADDGGVLRLLDPPDILYCESVDDHTYAYTASGVYGVEQTLTAIAEAFAQFGFLRCSKSMAVNLHAIDVLKGGDNGRIFATLANGERILISRRYARVLRERLKGD
jgi:DNA-binding LytR/AlgR family response regulator